MQNRIGESMTIQKMISELIARGWSQHSIAENVGTTQPTIHRAANGAGIRYETGRAIERLYESAVSDSENHRASAA